MKLFIAIGIILVFAGLGVLMIENEYEATKELNVLAPELVGLTGYINTDEQISLERYKGKVVIVDFWTHGCINCKRTLPYLKEWDAKYREKGLVIIGVHTPEFAFEYEYENVKRFVEENEINYPVVMDNNYDTWNAYQNRYWPHKFLIDKEGNVRYHHIGEGAYEVTEKWIIKLLEA